jgi:predicted alpha/beta-hydrolase family hydrolase
MEGLDYTSERPLCVPFGVRCTRVLDDKLTARVIGLVLLGFPGVMGGSTIALTARELRTPKLYALLLLMTLPLWIAGAVVLLRSRKLKD